VHVCRGFLPGPPYEPILGPLTRLPVAWLLLQPSRAAARHQQPGAELAVPVQINLTLPDYLVPGDAFDRGMRIEWRPADRFRMYFGRRQFGTRSGAHQHCLSLPCALACLLSMSAAPIMRIMSRDLVQPDHQWRDVQSVATAPRRRRVLQGHGANRAAGAAGAARPAAGARPLRPLGQRRGEIFRTDLLYADHDGWLLLLHHCVNLAHDSGELCAVCRWRGTVRARRRRRCSG